jgi:hypothetical protein
MKRLLLACLLLTACAPATQRPLALYIAQATQDVSADQTQQAGRITATAQRLAFQATETVIAHDVTVNRTQAAVNAAQTQQAMRGTQLALDEQGRAQTATAIMWPTVAYATSEAVYLKAEQGRIDTRNAQAVADGLIVLAWGVLLAVGGGALFGLGSLAYQRVEYLRHDTEMNLIVEDHARAQNAAAWAQVPPDKPEPNDTQEGIIVSMWKTRLGLFLAAGDRLGFSNRALCPGVVSNRNWGTITGHLIDNGVLEKDKDAKVGTRWARGVNLTAALDMLQSGALPCPTFKPVDVMFAGNAPRSGREERRETLTEGE